MRADRLQDDDLARREFERILLIKPSSLGDVLHGLPVLHGLRTRYPRARIDWLINKSFAPLLQGHPEIDELVMFDRGRYGRMAYSPGSAVDFARLVSSLRRRRYELVIDLQGLFRSGFMARATGAPVRIGFGDAREGAAWFYTHRLPPMDTNTHAVDRNYAVAQWLGFAEVPIDFPLPVDPKAKEAVAKVIREHFADGGDPQSAVSTSSMSQGKSSSVPPGGSLHSSFSVKSMPHSLLAVAPGARWATKLWPAERFAEVLSALTADGVRCMMLGGADDRPRCRQIVESAQSSLTHRLEADATRLGSPLDLSGRTSISELVAAISLADAVLCLDSAAAHVAAALGKPVVCITGPTNPARTGPYRSGRIVRLELDCSPCYYRRMSQCPYDHRCMRDLKAAEVAAAVRQALHNSLTPVS